MAEQMLWEECVTEARALSPPFCRQEGSGKQCCISFFICLLFSLNKEMFNGKQWTKAAPGELDFQGLCNLTLLLPPCCTAFRGEKEGGKRTGLSYDGHNSFCMGSFPQLHLLPADPSNLPQREHSLVYIFHGF